MNSWTSWLRLQSCVSSSVCVCRRGTGWWWWARWTRRLSPSRPAAQSTSQLEIFSWNVLLNYLWVNPSKYLTGPLMKIAAAVSNSSLQCVFLQIRTKLWISWDWLNQMETQHQPLIINHHYLHQQAPLLDYQRWTPPCWSLHSRSCDKKIIWWSLLLPYAGTHH